MELPAKHEEAGSEPVQPVDGPQVLQVVFLGQDEDYRVMAIAAAWVDLQERKTGLMTSFGQQPFTLQKGGLKVLTG